MSVEDVLDRLKRVKRNGKGWQALCPAHDDTNPSLSIDLGTDDRVLVFCHACGAKGPTVCRALDLDVSMLFASDRTDMTGSQGFKLSEATRRHPYRDENGKVLYTVAVFGSGKTKHVRPFLPNERQGFGDRKILYRLDELTNSKGLVFVVEGEKDADTLVAHGLTATSNPMGAGKFTHCDISPLEDRDVVVIGDNDAPGTKHVEDVVQAMSQSAASVRRIDLPDLPAGGDITDWLSDGRTIDALMELVGGQATSAGLYERGGAIFDLPSVPDALWGRDAEVLAAIGEPTVIYSATGVGKTTIAQRIVLAAIGIGDPEVLGYPVRQIEGKVLYVAADRPVQAMRSMRRMVSPGDRKLLDDRLVWDRRRRTTIQLDNPTAVLDAALAAGASLVVLDSVKDLVIGVSSEDGGSAYNNAVQHCVANGVEVIALHHPRKATAEGRSSLTLDDVYGSTWITAGAGSVIALNGVPGSGVAQLRHLKTPAEEVGPFDVDFDYENGRISTLGVRDVINYVQTNGTATTKDVLRYFTGKDRPTEAESKKVRRKLSRAVKNGYLERIDVPGTSTIWGAIS